MTDVRTLKLTIAYDGTRYCGWQVQPNGPTIQQALEVAFAKITGQRVPVTGSGRTDSGVHALGQVASCQVDSALTDHQWLRALNGNLPKDIRVLQVRTVGDFHAIRDAIKKRYRYLIDDGPIQDVFRRDFAWHIHQRLDAEQMAEAARGLIGTHDFRSYQAAGSDRKTTVRTVTDLRLERPADQPDEIRVEIEANGFLYNMVRNIVGTLVEVGLGTRPAAWPTAVLQARDRCQAGRTAPAHGLYLVRVTYADELEQGRAGDSA